MEKIKYILKPQNLFASDYIVCYCPGRTLDSKLSFKKELNGFHVGSTGTTGFADNNLDHCVGS